MFAIIETGGKQFRVSAGDKIKIEKLESSNNVPAEVGTVINFDKVLMIVDGDNMKLGTPTLSGAAVTGKVLEQGRAKKVIVFKYHSKTRRRKKNTHRQPFTEVEITGIK